MKKEQSQREERDKDCEVNPETNPITRFLSTHNCPYSKLTLPALKSGNAGSVIF